MQNKAKVIIIGAGPAGLATAVCLKKAGISFELLERDTQVGSSWRHHYRRLHLHTDKNHSELPYMSFPKDYPRYVSRELMIQYLENYARKFEIHPRFNTQVTSVRNLQDHWIVESTSGAFQAEHIVIASGYNSAAIVPQFVGLEKFKGKTLHSSFYKESTPFCKQSVLVVGMGNTGAELALDLAENAADVTLCVRSAVHITPRELFGIPIQKLAILLTSILPAQIIDPSFAFVLKLINGNLQQFGLRRPERGILKSCAESAKIPIVDIGTIKKIKDRTIQVQPGISEFTADGALFENGSHLKFDSVIFATGFRPSLERFFGDTKISPQTKMRGLHFIGFHNVITGLLREISKEARDIADAIVSSSDQK